MDNSDASLSGDVVAPSQESWWWSWFSWRPTSFKLLELAEKKMLEGKYQVNNIIVFVII